MKRRLFNLVAVVSLVLLVVVLVAWTRTQRPGMSPTDAIIVPAAGRCVIVASMGVQGEGFVQIWVSSNWPKDGAAGWSSGDRADKQVLPAFMTDTQRLPPPPSLMRTGRLTLWQHDGLLVVPHAQPTSASRASATPARLHLINMPSHYAAVATALLPLLWVMRGVSSAWRCSRPAANLCAACGYDLRATPQRCPECGTATPAAGGTKAA